MTTIDFTGPGVPEVPPFSAAPVSVSRFIGGHRARSALQGVADRATDAGEGVADRGVAAVQGVGQQAIEAAGSAAGDALGLPEQGEAADPEEIYEQVIERLRRDLIAELEQHGHLLRETL